MRPKFEHSDIVRKKAFKLDQENLKSLDNLLKDFSGKVVKLTEKDTDKPFYLKEYKGPIYNVTFKDKSFRRNLYLEDLLSLPNVRTEEITEIEADTNLSVVEYNISIRFNAEKFATFSNLYSIVSNDEGLFNTFDKEIKLFLEQIQKPFLYSIIRTNIFVFSFLVLTPALFIIIINLYSLGFGNYIDTFLTTNEVFTISIGGFVYIISDYIKDYLLPLGEIWIGKGKEKAQRLKNIRYFLLSVVFLGLVREAWNYLKHFL